MLILCIIFTEIAFAPKNQYTPNLGTERKENMMGQHNQVGNYDEPLMGGFLDGKLVAVARGSNEHEGWYANNVPEGVTLTFRELLPEEYSEARALLQEKD